MTTVREQGGTHGVGGSQTQEVPEKKVAAFLL